LVLEISSIRALLKDLVNQSESSAAEPSQSKVEIVEAMEHIPEHENEDSR